MFTERHNRLQLEGRSDQGRCVIGWNQYVHKSLLVCFPAKSWLLTLHLQIREGLQKICASSKNKSEPFALHLICKKSVSQGKARKSILFNVKIRTESLICFLYISSSLPSTMMNSVFVCYFQSAFQHVFLWPSPEWRGWKWPGVKTEILGKLELGKG